MAKHREELLEAQREAVKAADRKRKAAPAAKGSTRRLRKPTAKWRRALTRIPEAVRQPWLPQLLLCRLTILASRRDWSEWDQTLEQALALLPGAIGNPDDLAVVARLAGRTARAAGEAKRAWAVEEVFRTGGGLSSEA